MKKFFPALLAILLSNLLYAQEQKPDYGQLSGNFQTGSSFFIRDDKLGELPPQYKKEKSSNETFLFLNYKVRGFDFNLRYDFFSNSQLLAPFNAYTNHGIGFWSIGKDVGNLNITVGSFYDQFGTGLVFRAFEDRLIGIDYAIQGVRLKYKINNFYIKAFAGNQKGFFNPNSLEDSRFSFSPQSITGVNVERRFDFGSNFNFNLGASAVKRNLDNATMSKLVTEINALPLEDRFNPKYNTYAFNGYINMNFLKNFSLNLEYAGKTAEALRNPFSTRVFSSPGNVYLGSFSYSRKGFGFNMQYRQIDKFQFKSSPYNILLNGIITYLPTLTKQNTYRLLARYNPFSQELGEKGVQAEFIWSPNKKTSFNGNFSHVQSAGGEKLFREYYIDFSRKINSKFKFMLGFQSVYYNQRIYELNSAAPDVITYTPFGEFSFKLSPKRNLRIEWQVLNTKGDQGSFANLLAEYTVAPKWSFALGDMVNFSPVRTPGTPQELISKEPIHYYTAGVFYQEGVTRFTLEYKKQVAGVNCTGGICRVEPAFNGVRVGVTTTF